MSFLEAIASLPENVLFYFNIVQKNGPITINEIIEQTDISRGRLMRVFKQLEDEDLIVQHGNDESTGGRRSVLYDVNAAKYFFVGFSIGSARFSIHIVNIKGEHVASRTGPLRSDQTLTDFQVKADALIQEMINEHNIRFEQLVGLGVGVAGIVNRKQGFVIRRYSASLHSSWVNSPLANIFQSKFGLPALIDTNVLGEALIDYYYGEGRSSDCLLVVYCSMNISSAFISRGQTLRELNAYDDALAHMTIDIDGRTCPTCGNYGCVTTYSSVTAILDEFRQQIKIGVQTTIQKDSDDIIINDITEAAEAGDTLSKVIITKAAHVLGCGLANYIRLLNPDTIILAGMLIDNSNLYYSTVMETTKKRLGEYSTHHDIRFISEQASSSIPYSEAGAILYLENAINPQENLIPRFNSRTRDNT